MQQNLLGEPVEPKRKLGCSIAGWTVFLVLLAAVLFVGYRTWYYYDKIRRGELVDLPQFTDRFTAVGGSSFSSGTADRAAVETDGNAELGADREHAKLTIVEFADFECPYSKDEATIVRTLMAKYGDRVRLIYRHYPLETIHPSALEAAVAADCAKEQGKFWAYHDKLFLNSPSLGFQDLLRYAREAGLDDAQFQRCLEANRYKDAVMKDENDAKALGLEGTPTFFFNGRMIAGAIPQQTFEQLIQRMIK